MNKMKNEKIKQKQQKKVNIKQNFKKLYVNPRPLYTHL